MGDRDGPHIAKTIYGKLFQEDLETRTDYLEPDDIPYALDAAIKELQRKGLRPERWAPYIHIGL